MKFIYLLLSILCLNTIATTAQVFHKDSYSHIPPKREVRAVWLTTIGGLDWPKTYAHTPRTIEKQKQELCTLLDQLQKANMNTVLLQTRIRGTVIYPSQYEPWDGCVSGKPGSSPGYDPLQFAIEECHKRGMECHAWVVSVPVGRPNGTGPKNLKRRHPELLMKIGDEMFMRPEKKATADYIANICREITRNYDIDGIHLDYIRYPETMKLSISRTQARQNISSIVKAVHDAVKAEKPWVKMSCSPIGKRNDLNRYWSRGWNAEEKGCQDVERWMREGWMDQIYPMMYFKGDNFFPFAADWKERSHGKTVSAGLGIYFLSPKEANWKFEEIQREMSVCRQMGIGTAMFRNKFLMDNIKGLYDFTANEQNLYPALVPEMTWYAHEAPAMPTNLSIQRDNNAATLSWDNSTQDKTTRHQASTDVYYNVYASNTAPVDISDPRNIIAARTDKRSINVPLSPLTKHFAITAIDRYGKESRPLQSDNGDGEGNTAAAGRHGLIRNSSNTITLPSMPSTLDVEYILFESSTGCTVASRKYAKVLNIKNIPDGMYIIRSLSKKGKCHRLGWVFIKRR
ncbi:glycoside hydrolase family 10 protein [Prevotella sp.]|uniref:glycoside hydrolase family 10 protein n=1 Tax=Prevotella sp. TaxID=59823 RepID=UPI00307FE29D